ncbi:MAG: hypothetical protein N839_0009840 [Desulfofustis sp. PB-SRB1]|nr:hypothetical protein [Desulfofustis sp. PB-SRB1]MBM1002700.1 hypothetical protein [Desulfofustis sp. PB-SRB1]
MSGIIRRKKEARHPLPAFYSSSEIDDPSRKRYAPGPQTEMGEFCAQDKNAPGGKKNAPPIEYFFHFLNYCNN